MLQSDVYPDLAEWRAARTWPMEARPEWDAIAEEYEVDGLAEVHMKAASAVAVEMVTTVAAAIGEPGPMAAAEELVQALYDRVLWEHSPMVILYMLMTMADVVAQANGYDPTADRSGGKAVVHASVNSDEPTLSTAPRVVWFREFVGARLVNDEAEVRRMLAALPADDLVEVTLYLMTALSMTSTAIANAPALRAAHRRRNAGAN